MESFVIFFQYKMNYLVVSKKSIQYSCEGGIEKSVPRDHRLSSLVMPNGDSSQEDPSFITERLLIGHKESNQTNKSLYGNYGTAGRCTRTCRTRLVGTL